MKFQIKKKQNKNGGIVELLIPTLKDSKVVPWGDKNFFGKKNYGEVVLNRRGNDQIMPRFGRSLINDKCIFQ